MLHNALCLSVIQYYSNTERFCLHVSRQDGPPRRVHCLAARIQRVNDALTHQVSNQGFANFRLFISAIYQLSYATVAICYYQSNHSYVEAFC